MYRNTVAVDPITLDSIGFRSGFRVFTVIKDNIITFARAFRFQVRSELLFARLITSFIPQSQGLCRKVKDEIC